jgi:NDP-sugar pyrophosphorylase family protein
MKAMILAAGLGTRLKPFTDKHPKALALVNGKTLLQRNIEYLQEFNIKEVIVNVHHFAHQIIEYIEANNGWGSTISISNETNEVLETGGGLQKASWYFEHEENFVLMNADILTDLDLNKIIQQQLQQKPLATLAVTNRESSRYFLFNQQQQLCGWRNVKTNDEKIVRANNGLTQKAFSGIHVIHANIFSLIEQKGKFSMVDVYLNLANQHIIQCFDHSETHFIDVGKPENISIAEGIFI